MFSVGKNYIFTMYEMNAIYFVPSTNDIAVDLRVFITGKEAMAWWGRVFCTTSSRLHDASKDPHPLPSGLNMCVCLRGEGRMAGVDFSRGTSFWGPL